MADNYPDPYPDVGSKPADAESPPEQDEDVGETALLPKSILGGKDFKPGDEIVLKVEHIYDDEVEVSYASEPKEPETNTEPEMPMSADEEIDGMASMKGQ